jgi:hypothetical protein
MTDFRNDITKSFSRGLRNNNPGNIRPGSDMWVGQVGVSDNNIVFDSVENGLRALAIDLSNKQRLHNYDTLYKIFSVYAPWSDGNDPSSYANTVGNKIGIGANDIFKINSQNIQPLMRAVVGVELGNLASSYITDNMIYQGSQSVSSSILAWLGDNPVQSPGFLVMGIVGIICYVNRKKLFKSR